MPPTLALLLTIGFVGYLFWRESRNPVRVDGAMWIPLIWVLITGTRFVTTWLKVWGIMGGSDASEEEGSPLDALVFLVLIAWGMLVLSRRHVKLRVLVRHNAWLAVFFTYCLLAVLWSDHPFVAAKRWVKVLGLPVMVLVVLTDPNPREAVRQLFRRAAFVLIPFSVMCLKYYPHIGRGFDRWSGVASNRGINLNKNELGYVCLIMGIFFIWQFIQTRFTTSRRARLQERVLCVGFLAMIAWLLHMADSATSLACGVAGIGLMLVVGFDWINKRYLGTYLITAALVFGIAEATFEVYASTVKALGRNPTLTDRTEVWADALALADDPVLGTGFESFWLGERREKLWAKWYWQPNQAHNGYIETYLSLGWVGVILLLALIVATFKKIQKVLLTDFQMGRLRMGFLFVIVLYNFTEATFKGVHLVYFLFYLIALDYPRLKGRLRARPPQPAPGMVPA